MIENKFLKIKEYKDDNSSYFYAERLGVNSIAFILYDGNTGKYGLVKEFKPPIDKFLVTAFGGSLDKKIPMIDIVQEEVREEAGYINAAISYAGSCFVSTQMNQFCYLYLVDVTYAEKVPKDPQTPMEALATVEWMYKTEVISGCCWKAITILTKMGV